MGFVDAVKAFFSNYVKFEGRSSRSEYWWPVLFIFLVVLVLSFLAGLLGNSIGGLIGAAIGIFYLAIIIPSISVGVRRLHDQDKSGWFMLLALIPLVSLVLLVFMCLGGTSGPNRFGEDPLGNVGSTFN